LVAPFFFTAAISVVTGDTSLLTVPVMLSLAFSQQSCHLGPFWEEAELTASARNNLLSNSYTPQRLHFEEKTQ
jgi:hypothetical protein